METIPSELIRLTVPILFSGMGLAALLAFLRRL